MKHPNELELLDYISGEVSEDEKKLIAGHIESCPDCQMKLREFKETVTEYSSLTYKEPEAHYWTSFLPLLRERMRKPYSFNPRMITQVSAAITGTAIVILIVVMFAGVFSKPSLPMHFEEWLADNYDELYYSEAELANLDISSYINVDEDIINYLPYGEKELEEALSEMSSNELEEALQAIKGEKIL
jgi:hypothetical protein